MKLLKTISCQQLQQKKNTANNNAKKQHGSPGDNTTKICYIKLSSNNV